MLLTPQPASVAATMRTATRAAMRLKPWRSMGMAPRSRRGLDCVPRTGRDVVIDCGGKRGRMLWLPLPMPEEAWGEGTLRHSDSLWAGQLARRSLLEILPVAGLGRAVFSTSMELIHSPPDFTRSLVRSTMRSQLSGVILATSPVANQPSLSICLADASGLLK